jgi:hypothetical protein
MSAAIKILTITDDADFSCSNGGISEDSIVAADVTVKILLLSPSIVNSVSDSANLVAGDRTGSVLTCAGISSVSATVVVAMFVCSYLWITEYTIVTAD